MKLMTTDTRCCCDSIKDLLLVAFAVLTMITGVTLKAQINSKIEDGDMKMMTTDGLDSYTIPKEAWDASVEICEAKEYSGEYIWGPLAALLAGVAGFMGGKVPKKFTDFTKTWATYL